MLHNRFITHPSCLPHCPCPSLRSFAASSNPISFPSRSPHPTTNSLPSCRLYSSLVVRSSSHPTLAFIFSRSRLPPPLHSSFTFAPLLSPPSAPSPATLGASVGPGPPLSAAGGRSGPICIAGRLSHSRRRKLRASSHARIHQKRTYHTNHCAVRRAPQICAVSCMQSGHRGGASGGGLGGAPDDVTETAAGREGGHRGRQQRSQVHYWRVWRPQCVLSQPGCWSFV